MDTETAPTTPKKAKNPFAKTAKQDKPYFELTDGNFTYKVLKLYKSPEASLKDPYARAFCATLSPYTFGSWELGDGYVKDVPGLASALQNWIANHPDE